MNKTKLLKAILLISVMTTSSTCFANFKFDTLFGYYNLKAETNSTSGTLSALGLYSFHARKSVTNNLEIGIGYTLQMSKSFLGEVSYGPDLGFYFYPITNSSSIFAENATTTFKLQEKYRPYLGINFHQRNYQSAKSTYAGFSFVSGCEFDLGFSFLFNSQIRFLNLDGPQNSMAQEMNILGGFTFLF